MPRKPTSPIKSAAGWAKASLAQQKAHGRMLEVIQAKRARRTPSLSSLAKEFGTTLRTVRQHAGDIVNRDAKGRYTVRASDRFYRRMQLYDEKGKIEGGVGVVGSHKAAEVARYQNDVKRALKSRDDKPLRKYRGKSVRDQKVSHAYITDLATLDRLDAAGEISFENLYAHVG